MSKRDAYVAAVKLQLDELNGNIDKLEAKMNEATGDIHTKYLEEMRKLRLQSKLAVAKLNEVTAAGEKSWESMVTEMEKVRDAYVHAFHYFKSQL